MFTFINSNIEVPDPGSGPQRRTADSSDLVQLKADIARLYFITEALWRILREKHGLDEQEIIRQITAIDMEDGKLDGQKATTPPKPCPKCGRILARQRAKCMFCGEFIAHDPFDR